jgi:Ca2+/Na+ antiporter
LPLKATVAYLNANAQWLVLANPVLTVLALICLIATTVSVIKNFKATDKKNNRIRRVYFVLLGATLLIVLSAVIKGVNQTTGALAFYAFYYGFILLASYSLSSEDVEKNMPVQTEESTETDATEKTKTACKCCKCCKLCKTLLTVALALSAVAFLVAIPALFGFETIALWTKMIGWLTIL